MKKKFLIVTIIFMAVLLLGAGYLYRLYNPDIKVGVGGGNGLEIIHIAFSEPISKEMERNILVVGEWNNAVVTELMNETGEHRDIKVSGEVVDGKTTLRYEGYYMAADGKKVDVLEEKTFDFVLVPGDELLK